MLYPSVHCRARRRRCQGPVSRATTWIPGRRFLEQLDDDLARAGEPDDVAGDLRDGRGDQRSGRSREKPSRDRPAPCGLPARRTMSASSADRDADLVVPALARGSSSGSLSRGAQLALQQVAGGVDLPLPSPVTAGQGEQHRTAPLGRRLGVLAAASRYSTRSRARVRFSCAATAPRVRAELRGQRLGVLPGDLVREQRLRARGRSAASSARCASRPLLRGEQLVLGRGVGSRRGRRPGAGCAAAGPRSLPHRGDDVARGDDGVRLEHARARSGRAAASTRTSVSCTRSSTVGPVRYPRPHDPSDDRDQAGDRAGPGRSSAGLAGPAAAMLERYTRSPGAAHHHVHRLAMPAPEPSLEPAAAEPGPPRRRSASAGFADSVRPALLEHGLGHDQIRWSPAEAARGSVDRRPAGRRRRRDPRRRPSSCRCSPRRSSCLCR